MRWFSKKLKSRISKLNPQKYFHIKIIVARSQQGHDSLRSSLHMQNSYLVYSTTRLSFLSFIVCHIFNIISLDACVYFKLFKGNDMLLWFPLAEQAHTGILHSFISMFQYLWPFCTVKLTSLLSSAKSWPVIERN